MKATGTTYSTTEIVEACGLTYRQVDFMVRTGALKPVKDHPGTGNTRVFGEKEKEIAVTLGIIHSLTKKYLALNSPTIKQIAKELRDLDYTPSIYRFQLEFSVHRMTLIIWPNEHEAPSTRIPL